MQCTPPINVEGFDTEMWQADKKGCLGERAALAQTIYTQKTTVLNSRENSVVKLLGKPDRMQLGPRNRKIFYYFLEGGPQCQGDPYELDSLSHLTIYVNATGLVNDITLN